jgi:hypothetical protein
MKGTDVLRLVQNIPDKDKHSCDPQGDFMNSAEQTRWMQMVRLQIVVFMMMVFALASQTRMGSWATIEDA